MLTEAEYRLRLAKAKIQARRERNRRVCACGCGKKVFGKTPGHWAGKYALTSCRMHAYRLRLKDAKKFNKSNLQPVTEIIPQHCECCGKDISQTRTGRPRKFCNAACRIRNHRSSSK